MPQRRAGLDLAVPVALTAGIVLARAFAVAPLSDPLGAPLPKGLHLALPWSYVLLAPLFTLWDGVSMLSMRRLEGFLIGMGLLYPVVRAALALARRGTTPRRELIALVLTVLGLAGFIAGGLLWHRPMAALAGTAEDELVVDFHTHTRASHDVGGTLMDRYDAPANLRWHRRAGFDAVFLTDHNIVTRAPGSPAGVVACPGIEVSAWRAHILLLGDTAEVDRTRYNRDLDGLLDLLRASEDRYGALTVASTPEYQRNHWGRLDTLVANGLDGFEIVNASPKANELTRSQRDTVVALARRTGRFVIGVSDHHGWGATSMVWNVTSLPGWRAAPERVCAKVLDRLREGFGTMRIVERHRLRPDDWRPRLLTPLGVVWETWRSMGLAAAVSWAGWVWGVWALRRWRAGA
jgi:predicted metal-dependent phosphoesterase TrpH